MVQKYEMYNPGLTSIVLLVGKYFWILLFDEVTLQLNHPVVLLLVAINDSFLNITNGKKSVLIF